MSTAADAEVCICLGRIEESAEWDGRPYARDLGHRAGMVPTREARALVWLLRGTDADVEKARAYCAEPGCEWEVYVLPVEEPDPIAATKRAVHLRHPATPPPGTAPAKRMGRKRR